MTVTDIGYPPVVLLMGPTASGKSALAVKLAQNLNAEIISVDSALVYQGMDIGTAKPTIAERGGIVHHLIDIIDPKENFSTGQFRTQALQLIADISSRGKLPLLVGGTMLYFHTLTQGLALLPKADTAIRQRLEQELTLSGSPALHARLQQIDPLSAARIHPNDPQRIQRALEVYEISGKPLSALFSQTGQQIPPYRFSKLIIAPAQRSIVHERIAARFQQMLAHGLIAEVAQLYRRGDLSEELPSIRCVGYRQVWRYLQGEYDLETMTEKAVIATRQLAKRQFTWLRRETNAAFFDSDDAQLYQKVRETIAAQMRLG